MPGSLKDLLRQITPPAFLSWKRRAFAGAPPAEDAATRALRVAHERLNAGTPSDQIRLRPGLTLSVHPESRVAFEAFCFRYPDMVEEMDSFIRHAAGRHRFLDIGALHGVFSLVFACPDAARSAVAVDASPMAFARLLYNVHRNRASNVTPVECALSDGPGVLHMHYEWEHAVSAGTLSAEPSLAIEKKTGDSLCASLRFEPDLIKIDVEGHEVKVLNGLRDTLHRLKPLIFLEVHPSRIQQDGDRLEDLDALLTEFRYRVESTRGETRSLHDIKDMLAERVVLRSH